MIQSVSEFETFIKSSLSRKMLELDSNKIVIENPLKENVYNIIDNTNLCEFHIKNCYSTRTIKLLKSTPRSPKRWIKISHQDSSDPIMGNDTFTKITISETLLT